MLFTNKFFCFFIRKPMPLCIGKIERIDQYIVLVEPIQAFGFAVAGTGIKRTLSNGFWAIYFSSSLISPM